MVKVLQKREEKICRRTEKVALPMHKKGNSMMFFLILGMLLVTKLLADTQRTLVNFNSNLTSDQMNHLNSYHTCTRSCEIQTRQNNLKGFGSSVGDTHRLTAESKRNYDQSFLSTTGHKQCTMQCHSNFSK